MTVKWMMIRALLFLCLGVAVPAAAQPTGETLRMPILPGYRQAQEQRDGDWTTTEWLPAGQQRGTWDEQLLRDVGRGQAMVEPIAFRDSLANSATRPCTVGSIRDGHDNGYRYALWAASCHPTNTAGRIEETWYKAILGRDALYVVRKAFAYNPYDRDVTRWVAYLGRVQLCDPRLPDRPCRR